MDHFCLGRRRRSPRSAKIWSEWPPVVILRLRNMTVIDSTGLQTLQRFADEVHGSGRTLILCGAREQPARLMLQAEFEQHVGVENICPHVRAALERASAVYLESGGRWKSIDDETTPLAEALGFGL